jgi:hypothetical protein
LIKIRGYDTEAIKGMEKPYQSVPNSDIVHERELTNASLHRRDIYSAILGNVISGSHALAKGSYKERML